MKGISTNDIKFLINMIIHIKIRQNIILTEWYKTSIHQNNWYVVRIFEQKRPLAVDNVVKTGFGMHLVGKSH